jgi:hypothetical protein
VPLQPTYRPSAAYQFYASGVTPSPAPQSVSEEGTSSQDRGFKSASELMQSRVLSGRERDLVIAAARRSVGSRMKFSRLVSHRQEDDYDRIKKALGSVEVSQPQSPAEENPLLEMAGVDATPPCYLDRCWRTGGDVTKPANVQMGPIFPGVVIGSTQTASGMSIVYTGGDQCYDKGNGINTPQGTFDRQIRFHLVCTPEVGGINSDVLVVESSLCAYDVAIRGIHGCPSQCIPDVNSDLLCNGQGVCGWDTYSNAASCFCYTGYSGPQCTSLGDQGSPHPTGHPDMVVGGFFGGIFAGLVVGGGALYYIMTHGAPSFGSPARATAPAASSSSTGRVGGIRAMFGGATSSYAPPTLTSGGIPGIDDDGTHYAAASGGDEDADNPML